MTTVPETYKAYVYSRYGKLDDVLKLAEVATEPLPATHVRIRIRSASLNPIDYKLVEVYGAAFTGSTPSDDKPLRIGFDFAGVVAEIGAEVTSFRVGDEVFGKGSRDIAGSLGEYLAIDASIVSPKPKTVNFDRAAGVPGVGLTSYQAVTVHAKLQSGERLLVLGGSSSCGIFAIQLAKAIGAYVIATTSTKNVEFVKSLGADEVIDYRTQQWGDILERHSIDVVYDCSVEPTSWEDRAQIVLKENTGRFVTLRRGLTPSAAKSGATYSSPLTKPSGQDLAAIAELIDAGKIRLFIDSVFSFDQVLAAFARVKTERAVGKVIVQVASS